MIPISTQIIYGINGQPLSAGSGYGDAGASYSKRALKAFRAVSGNSVLDIDAHNSTLRQRSRVLYMAAPIATSAIKTSRTDVIGCGLRLKSRLDKAALGLSPENAAVLEKLIESEFALWAEDKRACDATGINDFYGIQQLAYISWLLSGDSFVLFKQRDPTTLRPYSLRLHLLEADLICTPAKTAASHYRLAAIDGNPVSLLSGLTEGKAENGNIIHDGVEVDKEGQITAYYVCSDYPETKLPVGDRATWIRVPAYGEESDLPNILQIMDTERPGQYRGVPYLAQVIEPLLQTRRYAESELMAALVESFFTAFIMTNAPANSMPFNEIGSSMTSNDNEYELGPGAINIMNPGEDVKFADPKRPTSGFETFARAICVQMGAALEVPADLLLKSFNSSYSASRAALLEAWKSFKMRRGWFVSDFCQPIYAAWMSEAVARGRIDAPGFFEDPLIRAAWLGNEWIGPSQGQIDPVKEVQAELLAISQGLTTREQATVRLNGGSWDANVEQLKLENSLLAAAGPIDISAATGIKGASEEDTNVKTEE